MNRKLEAAFVYEALRFSTIDISAHYFMTSLNVSLPEAVRQLKQLLREIYKARGYIIIGTPPGTKYAIGTILTKLFNVEIVAQFEVTSYADQTDWIKQNALIAFLRPTWKPLAEEIEKGSHFYRVVPRNK